MLKTIALLSATLVLAAPAIAGTVNCTDTALPDKPCGELYDHGQRTVLSKEPLLIVAADTPSLLDKGVYVVEVTIKNMGSRPLTVDPSRFSMSLSDGSQVMAADPVKQIKDYELHQQRRLARDEFWGAALVGAVGGNDNAVAVDSSPGHSVAYQTSYIADRASSVSTGIGSTADAMRTNAFLQSTIQPGAIVSGYAYFKLPKAEKKAGLAFVTVPVDGTLYSLSVMPRGVAGADGRDTIPAAILP